MPDEPAAIAGADEVTGEVLRSRRYRWLAADVVRRLARVEAPKARTRAEAVKRTKRRLHQIFGAYVFDVRPERALRRLAEASASGGAAGLQEACRTLLGQHASTRERLPILGPFYERIFE